jgi:hypothetical protein
MISHSSLKLTSVAFFMGWLCLRTIGYAEISSVRISPAQPTVEDTIIFSVAGMFPDGCWGVYDFTFTQLSPSQFAADVYALDIAQYGYACPEIVVEYFYSATLGPLGPGTYTIFVTENHQSLREPWPNESSLTFEVRDYLPPVSGLTASRSGSNIVLRWTAVEGATGYRIYRAPVFAFEIAPSCLLDSTVAPGYTDNNVILLPDEKSFYSVTAVR